MRKPILASAILAAALVGSGPIGETVRSCMEPDKNKDDAASIPQCATRIQLKRASELKGAVDIVDYKFTHLSDFEPEQEADAVKYTSIYILKNTHPNLRLPAAWEIAGIPYAEYDGCVLVANQSMAKPDPVKSKIEYGTKRPLTPLSVSSYGDRDETRKVPEEKTKKLTSQIRRESPAGDIFSVDIAFSSSVEIKGAMATYSYEIRNRLADKAFVSVPDLVKYWTGFHPAAEWKTADFRTEDNIDVFLISPELEKTKNQFIVSAAVGKKVMETKVALVVLSPEGKKTIAGGKVSVYMPADYKPKSK